MLNEESVKLIDLLALEIIESASKFMEKNDKPCDPEAMTIIIAAGLEAALQTAHICAMPPEKVFRLFAAIYARMYGMPMEVAIMEVPPPISDASKAN